MKNDSTSMPAWAIPPGPGAISASKWLTVYGTKPVDELDQMMAEAEADAMNAEAHGPDFSVPNPKSEIRNPKSDDPWPPTPAAAAPIRRREPALAVSWARADVVWSGGRTKQYIFLEFPYDVVAVAAVKRIPEARWQAREKGWLIPRSWTNALKVIDLFPVADTTPAFNDLARDAQALFEKEAA